MDLAKWELHRCESQLSEHSSKNSCKCFDECLKYKDCKSMRRGSLVPVGVSFRAGWTPADLGAVFDSKLVQELTTKTISSIYPTTIIFYLSSWKKCRVKRKRGSLSQRKQYWRVAVPAS